MKKLFSLMLAVWMAVCALSVGASAEDAADDGWSTYSGTVSDYATFTLKAKGNEIKIEITGDLINGDELTCPGTKNNWFLDLFGKSDGRALVVDFEDGPVNEGGNKLKFGIDHTCGIGAAPHKVSLKNDVTFSVMYCSSVEPNAFGTETSTYDFLEPGYSGKWGSEECSKLQLSVDGHTLTMSTTLPDQAGSHELKLNNGDLTVKGSYAWVYGATLFERIQRVIDFFRELFAKFIAFFRNMFGI